MAEKCRCKVSYPRNRGMKVIISLSGKYNRGRFQL